MKIDEAVIRRMVFDMEGGMTVVAMFETFGEAAMAFCTAMDMCREHEVGFHSSMCGSLLRLDTGDSWGGDGSVLFTTRAEDTLGVVCDKLVLDEALESRREELRGTICMRLHDKDSAVRSITDSLHIFIK